MDYKLEYLKLFYYITAYEEKNKGNKEKYIENLRVADTITLIMNTDTEVVKQWVEELNKERI